MGEPNRQAWIVPDDDAALRPAKGFPCRSRQDCRSLSQWILVLVAGDEAKLVSTIKEDRASPFSDNLMHDCFMMVLRYICRAMGTTIHSRLPYLFSALMCSCLFWSYFSGRAHSLKENLPL